MQLNEFFKELFEYSHQSNQKLIDLLLEHQGQLDEDCTSKMNHILNAHQVWNTRIHYKHTPPGVWEIRPIEHYKQIDEMNFSDSLEILDQHQLDEVIAYKTTQGVALSNSLRDILMHVVNHSTYHRGQIATGLKRLGISPIASDFILFKR